MALPLYLAVTGAEMSAFSSFSQPLAYLACHFSPYTQGITNIPQNLPLNSILILTDRTPCQGHSADLVAKQLGQVISEFGCESLLLDFQRPAEAESIKMAETVIASLPCPVAVTQNYAADLQCPVFLSPAPLHMPFQEYLKPWQGREIWLEAALEQEEITVRQSGAEFTQQFPASQLEGGFFDETLCCRYLAKSFEDRITFTLFDTLESLEKKLELAQSLGVTRAVGLWQELGTFLSGK